MPKIDDNGIIREMTAEEVAEMERMEAETPEAELTPEEQIERQAQEIAELKEALELLLSGATEVTDNG